MNGLTPLSIGLYIGLAAIFVLLTAATILSVGRRFLNLLTRSNNDFGHKLHRRLFGLTIAAFILPEVPRSIFGIFIRSASHLVDGVRLLVLGFTDVSKIGCSKEPECSASTVSTFAATMYSILRDILAIVGDLPINRAIAFFAIWTTVSYLLDNSHKGQNTDDQSLISRWYILRNQPALRNAVFFILLGFSSYLCMAAILALPALEEKGSSDQEIGIEKLKVQLKSSASALEQYQPKIDIPEIKIAAGAIDTLYQAIVLQKTTSEVTSLEKSATPTPTPVSSNTNRQNSLMLTEPQIISIKQQYASLQQTSTDLLVRYARFVESAREEQASEQDKVLTSYAAGSLVGKGNKERIQYYFQLSQWANKQSRSRFAYVRDCNNAIQRISEMWRIYSLVVSRPLIAFTDVDESQIRLSASIDEANQGCSYSADDAKSLASDQMPERLRLGEATELGPFHFFASWLLRTESLSFALITGLLGFGLLGSACSTFIRERTVRNAPGSQNEQSEASSDSILVNDLTEVVIRGVAAAVVVFMAMQGGLAIFSSGNGQPNSYVLLMTCLVAAVFSESIWNYVYDQLTDRLHSNGQEHAAGDEGNKHTPKIEPATSSTAGGGTARITGVNFQGIKSVRFGTVEVVNPELSDASEILVSIPAHEVGKVAVTIESQNGEIVTLEFEYTDV